MCAAACVFLLAISSGSVLVRPANDFIGHAPVDLGAIDVEFDGLKGWYVASKPQAPCVLLMHGIRSDRRSMIDRARFLRNAGYASLLFDFQAHGESRGQYLTFGFLESKNARSAVSFLRSRFHCKRIGVIGQSLGGAAALLGDKSLEVEAIILESVYSAIDTAISNRLRIKLGVVGPSLTPLLTAQIQPRLGINTQDLRPIDKISSIRAPVYIISGGLDQHTTIEDSERLFHAAPPKKEIWIMPGVGHVDLHKASPFDYQMRILQFFGLYLQ